MPALPKWDCVLSKTARNQHGGGHVQTDHRLHCWLMGALQKITSQTPISHGFVATLPFDRLYLWPGGSLFYKILYVCFSFLPKSMHSMTRILSQSEERYFCSDQYTKFCNGAAY